MLAKEDAVKKIKDNFERIMNKYRGFGLGKDKVNDIKKFISEYLKPWEKLK